MVLYTLDSTNDTGNVSSRKLILAYNFVGQLDSSWVSLGYFAVNLSGGQPEMY